jgi:acetoin utilization deacetylase AcuC-like enzyme
LLFNKNACFLLLTYEHLQRAFVIGRPPGHHAGPSGCVPSEHFWLRPDMTSSGFCLLNTVAMAAAYARYNYSIVPRVCGKEEECVRGHPPGSRPLRVAIVDIDVHHGNGTEEIVKNLR